MNSTANSPTLLMIASARIGSAAMSISSRSMPRSRAAIMKTWLSLPVLDRARSVVLPSTAMPEKSKSSMRGEGYCSICRTDVNEAIGMVDPIDVGVRGRGSSAGESGPRRSRGGSRLCESSSGPDVLSARSACNGPWKIRRRTGRPRAARQARPSSRPPAQARNARTAWHPFPEGPDTSRACGRPAAWLIAESTLSRANPASITRFLRRY